MLSIELKYKIVILALVGTLSFIQNTFSQREYPYLLRHDEPAPLWVQKMYSENPDPDEVIALYEAYYEEHPFVKNQHTQFYKRWLSGLSKRIVSLPETDEAYLEKYFELKQQRLPASWTPIGPYDWDHSAAGRSYCPGSAHVYTVEQSLSNPDILFAGTANAGVWKSTDHGLHWTACTNDFLSGSVTSIEIDPVNPLIVYAELSASIYKSINGGLSWLPTGDAAFQALDFSVRDIRCHPDDPLKVFAATNAGLYRSTNGGLNWTNIFSGEIQEIEMHPTRPDTMYIVQKDGMRTRFFRSYNEGNSFTEANSGWPSPNTGLGEHQERTEIAVTPDAPNHVYALATGSANGGSGLYGVYKSTDLGVSWAFTCCGPGPGGPPSASNPNLMGWSDQGLDDGGQYYYDLAFAVSPFNKDSIWVCGVNLWVSGNEGSSFVCPSAWSHSYKPNFVHADIHDLHYIEGTGELWLAGDGGIFYSTDRGANFHRRNVGILGTDFWGYGQGYWEGNVMLGGAYHNGTMLKEDSVYINGWICTDGGDGVGGYVNPGYDKQVYSWFNMKDLKSNRTIDPVTRDYYYQPNSTYITGQSSDLLFHPHYYGTWYTGSGKKIYITRDNGYSYDELHNFNADVASMDMSVSDPDVIYACTFPGWWDIKRIYRSDNGGTSWTEITPHESILNHPNDDWVPYDIVVSPDDPMKVWIARTSMYNGYPNLNGYTIYKSVNGGTSWTNISGTSLNGEYPTCLIHQRGTNEGLYVGTRRAVYYKNADMSAWTLYNAGLPARIHSAKLATWYRAGKLRNATDRSVWETPFYEESDPVAIPSVQKQYFFCQRDTAYFSDMSVLSEEGATWAWNFPGGTPAVSNLRNPKVVYSQPGEYDVTLTVADANGNDTKTITDMIIVDNRCHVDTTAGGALKQVAHPDYVRIKDLNLTTLNFTVTAWVKPTGIQDEYTSIFMNDGNAAGFNFREANNTLAYHWPGGAWWWDSGLEVPAGQWSYVAMVVQPGLVTLYVNGYSSSHATAVETVTFDDVRIGNYQGWGGRTFRGEMDEVCIWNRALSQDEIRMQRHLIKNPETDNTIRAYYQFDRNVNSGFVIDKASGKDGVMNSNATIVESNAPIGSGTSEIKNITSSGVAVFNNGGDLEINFGVVHPNGKVVVSHLRVPPDTIPDGLVLQGGQYIVNNYGTNQLLAPISQMLFKKCGSISNHMASSMNFDLFKRGSNATGLTWTSINSNSTATPGLPGNVNLTNINEIASFSQFIMMRSPVAKGNADVVISTSDNPDPLVPGGESISLLVYSSSQAIRLPILTSATLNNLGIPAPGQLAFLTDSAAVIYFNGSEWLAVDQYSILADDQASPPVDPVTISIPSGPSGNSYMVSLGNGFLKPPSYTSADILTIDKPAPGMLVYDASIGRLRIYNGDQWQSLHGIITALPVSTETPDVVTGVAINQNYKHALSALEINSEGKALQLPLVQHQEIYQPVMGLICFDPANKCLMMHDGERWNILQ